jgi:hypothetical protein
MLKLSRHGSMLPVSVAYLLTASGGFARYIFGDRRCADCTRAKAGIIASPGSRGLVNPRTAIRSAERLQGVCGTLVLAGMCEACSGGNVEQE